MKFENGSYQVLRDSKGSALILETRGREKLSVRHGVVDAVDEVLANGALRSGRELLNGKAGLNRRENRQDEEGSVQHLHSDRDDKNESEVSSDQGSNRGGSKFGYV